MKKLVPLLLFSLALAILAGCAGGGMTTDEAKDKVESFINDTLMAGAPMKAEVKEVVKENGLFKITVNAGGQTVDSYLTMDGELFFPQAMDIAEVEDKAKDVPKTPEAKAGEPAPKQDTAKVELFVMSHCPYGTQIEKGIIPVLETLGDKVDFELKFCDYAMHGEKEVDEQLNQLCIQEQGRDVLIDYLKCFLEAGDGAGCIGKSGVDKGAMESCFARLDKEFSVKADLADKSTWRSGRFPLFAVHQEDAQKYGVSGSPSLVLNGQKISSSRNSSGLLATICGGYNEAPEECDAELDSTNPSPGFGYGTGGGGASGGCGG